MSTPDILQFFEKNEYFYKNISIMGKQGITISSVDVDQLLKMLNAALAEEWLAYYQYWIGAQIMEGPMRSEIEPELMLHANQELGHALLVVNRIV